MLDLARARLRRARRNSNTASSCGKQQQSHEARKQPSPWGPAAKEDELDHLVKLRFRGTQR